MRPAGRLSAVGSARCWWSEDGIALVSRFLDSDLRASVTEHDGRTWDDDVVEWFLAPNDSGPYVELHVTPRGTTLELLLPSVASAQPHPFHLDSAVFVEGTLNDEHADTAGQAAMVLPWSDLPGDRP